MNEQQKKLIVIGSSIFIILIFLILFFINLPNNSDFPSSEELAKLEEQKELLESIPKEEANPILKESISRHDNTTIITPVDMENMEEELKEEPLLPENFESKPAENPTKIVDDYTNIVNVQPGETFTLWGIDFSASPQYNKITNKNTIISLRTGIYYKENPNELKEQIMGLINSFCSENSNVIFKRNVHIKNIKDIPEYGIRIISEDDNDLHYLYISQSYENNKIIYIEYYIFSKTEQHLLALNQNTVYLISIMEDMLKYSSSTFTFKKAEEISLGVYNIPTDTEYDEEITRSTEAEAIYSMYGKLENIYSKEEIKSVDEFSEETKAKEVTKNEQIKEEPLETETTKE